MEVSSRTDSFGELRATPARRTATCKTVRQVTATQCWFERRHPRLLSTERLRGDSHSKRVVQCRSAASDTDVPACVQLQLLPECV